MENKLKICSIFLSINGECCHSRQGSWAVFVRAYGCGLGCSFCDSTYSWNKATKYREYTIPELLEAIKNIGKDVTKIVYTGGEPLEQPLAANVEFLTKALNAGYSVSIETNGAHSINTVLEEVSDKADISNLYFVVDIKPGTSKQYKTFSIKNLLYVSVFDTLKFIISNEEDFKIAVDMVNKLMKERLSLYLLPKIYFSALSPKMTPDKLFILLKKTEGVNLNVINLNVQLHKYIFPKNFREEEN